MGHGLLTTQRKARGGLLSQHVGLGNHQTHFPDWGLMRQLQAPLHTWAGWLCGRYSVQFSSVAQSCLTLCDPMDCSTPGFSVHHQGASERRGILWRWRGPSST